MQHLYSLYSISYDWGIFVLLDSKALTRIKSMFLITIIIVVTFGGVVIYIFWAGEPQSTDIIKIGVCSDIGSYDDTLKGAKVVPIYKKENKSDVGNYRPVSVLGAMSKVLERVIYDQIESYLLQNNIIYEFQSETKK